MSESRFKYIVLLIGTYIGFTGVAFGQERQIPDNEGRFRTLEVRYHAGGHLYSGETLNSKVESGYGALEARFAWQSKDPEIWGKFGYPSYGIGIYSGFIGDPDVFGNPNAIYSFINFPISRPTRRNVFSIEPALGLTYNLEPFDAESNPLNDAIGARMAVYFNLNFGWAYRWTREMDITYGIDLSHFSNGRSYTPNYGLNMFGINVGLRYHYNADANHGKTDPYQSPRLQARYQRGPKLPDEKIPKNESLNLYLALGTVQNEEDAGTDTRFSTYSIVLDYQHKFNTMHSISGGIDFFVDNSLKESYPQGDGKTTLLGVHAGYDFMFYRFTILLHGGTYLTERLGKSDLFLRPAIRYDFAKWAFAQVGLKTIGYAADWVEFGIGFRPFRW